MKRSNAELNRLLEYVARWCGMHQNLLAEYYDNQRLLREQLANAITDEEKKKAKARLQRMPSFPPPQMLEDVPQIVTMWPQGDDPTPENYRIVQYIREWQGSKRMGASVWWAFRGKHFEIGRAPPIPEDAEMVLENQALADFPVLCVDAATALTETIIKDNERAILVGPEASADDRQRVVNEIELRAKAFQQALGHEKAQSASVTQDLKRRLRKRAQHGQDELKKSVDAAVTHKLDKAFQNEKAKPAGQPGTSASSAPPTSTSTVTKTKASVTVRETQLALPSHSAHLARMQKAVAESRRAQQRQILEERINIDHHQHQAISENHEALTELPAPVVDVGEASAGGSTSHNIQTKEMNDGIFKLADFVPEFEALALRQSLYFRVENHDFVLMLRSEVGDQWFSRLLMIRDEHSTIRLAEFTGCQEEFNEEVEHWLKEDYGPNQLMEALHIKCVEYFQQSQAQ